MNNWMGLEEEATEHNLKISCMKWLVGGNTLTEIGSSGIS